MCSINFNVLCITFKDLCLWCHSSSEYMSRMHFRHFHQKYSKFGVTDKLFISSSNVENQKKLANAYIIGHTIKVQKGNRSAHAAGQVTEFFHRHPFSFDNFPHSLRKSANCVGNTVSFGTKVVDCHGRAAHLSR